MAPLNARATQHGALAASAAGMEFPLRWLPGWMAGLIGDDSAASCVASKETAQSYEDVIVGAQRLFKSEGWRITSESARMTTLVGKPRTPWHVTALTSAALFGLVVPGVLHYRRRILRRYGVSNIVVSATAVPGGTHAVIEYPAAAEGLAKRFMESLPEKPNS